MSPLLHEHSSLPPVDVSPLLKTVNGFVPYVLRYHPRAVKEIQRLAAEEHITPIQDAVLERVRATLSCTRGDLVDALSALMQREPPIFKRPSDMDLARLEFVEFNWAQHPINQFIPEPTLSTFTHDAPSWEEPAIDMFRFNL